jgi:hypothetical protein
MADNALVEGAIWDTIDLRRSVILDTGIVWIIWIGVWKILRCAEDSEQPESAETARFNNLVGQPRRRLEDWAEALGGGKSRVGK